MGRGRLTGTQGTWGDEYGSPSTTWQERGDDSTCVRIDSDRSVVLAWVVGFALARFVFQSVEFPTTVTQVESGIFVSVVDEHQLAVRRLEVPVFSRSLTPAYPTPSHSHQLLTALHNSCSLLPLPYPHSCSSSGCFRSPGLIYISIPHDLYLGRAISYKITGGGGFLKIEIP